MPPRPVFHLALFRLHASPRASRMVEMARLRRERAGSGVDPPRSGNSVARGSSPSAFQSRRFLSWAAPRPGILSATGNRKTHCVRSSPARGVLAVGLQSFLSAKGQRTGLASRRGSPRDQQRVPDEEDEDGDPAVFTSDREARRPLGLLRPQGRFLLSGDCASGPGSFHGQPQRKTFTVLRSSYGLELKPLRFSKTDGGVYRFPKRPGSGSRISGGTPEFGAKSIEAVASSPSQAHWSPSTPLRGRLCVIRRRLRLDPAATSPDVRPPVGTGHGDPPDKGALPADPHRRAH